MNEENNNTTLNDSYGTETESANNISVTNETQNTKLENGTNNLDNKEDVTNNSKEAKKPFWQELIEWIGCIAVAFLLAVFIKYFIFTPTLVKQSSMYPTITDTGERVFVNRLVRTFKLPLNRGDIITLEAPKSISGDLVTAVYDEYHGLDWFMHDVVEIGKISYIKRVVAISGDKVRIEGGNVYLNDELLDETEYLPDGTETYIANFTNHIKSEFVVPAGYIFAMGDNRNNSTDCRILGCIPVEKVEGRVVGRIWPLNKFGKITKSTITKEEVDEYDDRLRHTSDLY